MNNIWTRHLETVNVMRESEKNPFLARLRVEDGHSNPCVQETLVNSTIKEEPKLENEPSEVTPSFETPAMASQLCEEFVDIENGVPDVLEVGATGAKTETVEDVHNMDYTGEGVEMMQWSSKSHKGHDLRLNTYTDDVVRLIKLPNGKFLLKYSISGDKIESIPVDSIKEAESIIEEDNHTTEELYPDAPELRWVKTN